MRLKVSIAGNGSTVRGVTSYDIMPAHDKPNPEDERRLGTLCRRIKAMAEEVLGSSLIELRKWDGWLELRVKQGTSKGKKRFEFRNLIGWIELCDVESGPRPM